MSPFLNRTTLVACCALVISATAGAQAPAQPDAADSTSIPTLLASAPRSIVNLPAADVAALETTRPEMLSVVRRREAFDRPMVLMLVGGALLLTGLLIDDDASTVLYVAGAGIGAYGLYLYLQSPDARLRRR